MARVGSQRTTLKIWRENSTSALSKRRMLRRGRALSAAMDSLAARISNIGSSYEVKQTIKLNIW